MPDSTRGGLKRALSGQLQRLVRRRPIYSTRSFRRDLNGNPPREGEFPGDVATGRRMDLANLSESLAGEPLGRPNQRRPETAMDIGDLAVDDAAHENIF